ncbi:hypothetical protein Tco_0953215 [Tanacetum coccineum]|uniref:Uncharacterized protein n=1 Tax=Tanacetum coccineum TaxID=301880 RepID=A0ABQ5DZG8_9ASTR
MIDEDKESSNEGWRRWDDFDNTNHDNKSKNEMEHEDEERCFSIRRIPVYGYGVLDLAAKKSTKLVKYLQSGNLEVLES